MLSDFQQVQLQFTRYLRDPARAAANATAPALDRRQSIYRDLVQRNMHQLLADTFATTRALLGAEGWRLLVQDFIAVHHCQSPYAAEVGHEFLFYLMKERTGSAADHPFLCELAHFEWIRLMLHIADIELPASTVGVPDAATRWMVSPLVIALGYTFPVDWIDAQYVPSAPRPRQLLAYRKRNDQVCILEADLLSLRIVQLLQEHGPMDAPQVQRHLSADATLAPDLAREGVRDEATALAHLAGVMAQLADDEIVLPWDGAV